MSKTRKGLGKGLDALLGDSLNLVRPVAEGRDAAVAGDATGEQVIEIALDLLRPGELQPRRVMDDTALRELADSIRVQGIIQPLVVRPLTAGSDHFEIVAGERRWRAARMAGLGKVPALVRALEDRAVLAIGLIENIQREGLNPIDEANALARLIAEVGLTHEQCAEAVGRSRAAVSNMLRLLNLCSEVQDLLRHSQIEMGHGRALLTLEPALQEELAQRVVREGLSVRDTEALVRRLGQSAAQPASRTPPPLDDRSLQHRDQLADRLRAKVMLKPAGAGGGKIVIDYRNPEQLEAIFAQLLT
ncbi:MAG: ParB/RepB/Spo0J family partition protein [Oceanococcaceae bacterium]